MSYEDILADFQSRFRNRREAVLARLKSGQLPGIFDPAELPKGTRYAALYEEHRERLADDDRRLDEIFRRLAQYDSARIEQLVQLVQAPSSPLIRQEAVNELKLRLLFLEEALNASERDPSVGDMIDYCERISHLVMDTFGGYPDDFQELVATVYQANRNLKEQSDPEVLRNLYTMSDEIP